jgi:hypothetical protein
MTFWRPSRQNLKEFFFIKVFQEGKKTSGIFIFLLELFRIYIICNYSVLYQPGRQE